MTHKEITAKEDVTSDEISALLADGWVYVPLWVGGRGLQNIVQPDPNGPRKDLCGVISYQWSRIDHWIRQM